MESLVEEKGASSSNDVVGDKLRNTPDDDTTARRK